MSWVFTQPPSGGCVLKPCWNQIQPADLESTVRDLAYRVIANEDFVLDEENVVQAFSNVVPLSQTSPEKIAAIRDWGKERAVPASGKPIGAEEIKTNTESRTRKLLV